MRLSIIIPIALALLVGCKAASEVMPQSANPAETEKKATEVEARIFKAKPGDAMSQFTKDGIVKPHFPNGQIVGLNAIVKQAYDAIELYDDERKAIQTTVAAAVGTAPSSPAMQKAKAAIAKVERLHEITRDAKAKITVEGTKLTNSGQYYNIEIFGGMTLFIERVETELGEEVTNLNAALNKK
jgi:hypothetical protein